MRFQRVSGNTYCSISKVSNMRCFFELIFQSQISIDVSPDKASRGVTLCGTVVACCILLLFQKTDVCLFFTTRLSCRKSSRSVFQEAKIRTTNTFGGKHVRRILCGPHNERVRFFGTRWQLACSSRRPAQTLRSCVHALLLKGYSLRKDAPKKQCVMQEETLKRRVLFASLEVRAACQTPLACGLR